MARVTLVAFALLTGFFYVTGKPVDHAGQEINRFADLANHKVVAEQVVDRTSSKHLISNEIHSSKSKISDRDSKAKHRRGLAFAKEPELPSRNPHRIAARASKSGKTALARHTNTASKSIQLAKADTTKTFQQGRNKFTGGAAKPLGLSYQQRYVKSQKPVLGPRLTAVLVKRELRRIGCYRGNVTSNWDESARAAITSFNTNTGSNLATKTPLVSSLERLQQITKTVCVEQPVIDGTLIASAGQRKADSRANSFKKASKWRTKVRVRKAAYRPSTTSPTPSYNITRPRVGETYIAPPTTKPRRVKRRTRRAKRLKRIRVAKRKARRRTAVRSWRRTYRRKKFGFSHNGGTFSLN